jgi:hypothetical protein
MIIRHPFRYKTRFLQSFLYARTALTQGALVPLANQGTRHVLTPSARAVAAQYHGKEGRNCPSTQPQEGWPRMDLAAAAGLDLLPSCPTGLPSW